MVINKNYNSSDEEEWDMVPDEVQNTTEATAQLNMVEAHQNITPIAALNQEESTPAPSAPPGNPLPSAPLEEDDADKSEQVATTSMTSISNMGLAEEQAKLGITNDTSPEEILRLIAESDKTDSVPNDDKTEAEETPLLVKDQEDTNAATEKTSATPVSKVPRWLRASLGAASQLLKDAQPALGAATQVLKDVEQKHDIKQKTRQSLSTVGTSLRQVGSTLQKETEGIRTTVAAESFRISQTVQQKAEELDVKGKAQAAGDTISQKAKSAGDTISNGAKTAGDTISQKAKTAGDTIGNGAKNAGDAISKGAKTAGEKAKELNKDGKVTDFVAAAAVLTAGILLAKGKTGAGAAVLATGGAAYMAAETTNGRRHDQGLNENLHME